MDSMSREMEILEKNKKINSRDQKQKEEIIDIKNIIARMKYAFDGLISGLNTAEERIFEF